MISRNPEEHIQVPSYYSQVFVIFLDGLRKLGFTGAKLEGLANRAANILDKLDQDYLPCRDARLLYFGSKEVFNEYVTKHHLREVSMSEDSRDDVVSLTGNIQARVIKVSADIPIFNEISFPSVLDVNEQISLTREEAIAVFNSNINEYNRRPRRAECLDFVIDPNSVDLIALHETLVTWSSSLMIEQAGKVDFLSLRQACCDQIVRLDYALRALTGK